MDIVATIYDAAACHNGDEGLGKPKRRDIVIKVRFTYFFLLTRDDDKRSDDGTTTRRLPFAVAVQCHVTPVCSFFKIINCFFFTNYFFFRYGTTTIMRDNDNEEQ